MAQNPEGTLALCWKQIREITGKYAEISFTLSATAGLLILSKVSKNQKSNCQHPLDHQKSKRVPAIHLLMLYWLCQSLWLCGSQQTVENFFKRWDYQTTWSASWEIRMQVEKQQLELDMEQQTGSKSGKEYIKPVYCHPTYLTYMQSTSCKMLRWMKHKLESRLLGEIPITSYMQMTPPLWQKVKRN